MTYMLFNFCELGWLPILLSWLLPFLLGLLLGYAIWAKYKKMKEDLEREIKGHKATIKGLESDLEACRHRGTDLESEIALLKGQMREKDLKISTLESSLSASKNKGGKSVKSEASSLAGAAVAASGLSASVGGKKKKDDLKKVEGIGPKIEGLLNDAKIWTFADLASTSISRLKEILEAAGPRYRIASPETWPDQSALARDGKWDDLEKLQDSLKGGRKT